MVRVAHKYMPDHMPEDEFKATFTARRHTLDYLIAAIRQQIPKQTLTSFLITGPRGSGKTTLMRMLYLELCNDQDQSRAWLCVRFPEELPNVASLRDLLAATLEMLAEQGVAEASHWHDRVEADMDEQHSQELAITGLRQITQAQGRRLILLVENLDLLFARGLTESSQATLRRLLMTDPFMMIIGSTVQIFPAVRTYEEAFFNYFCPVPLERLTEEQACDILRRRAAWDHNTDFERQYQSHRSKIRTISLLTGGNPRMLLMLYEILALQQMESVVNSLRTLVDELTPLLKDILEHQLTGQQVRILNALMQLDGKAQPTQLAQKSRLPLNAVTSQLRRLVEADVLAVQGGGKGRPAWYTVTDRLFYTWYQMRYLRPQRRRIEMFVQVLQHWFEAEERLEHLKTISLQMTDRADLRARSLAQTAEYLADSLSQTPLADRAHILAIQNWIHAGDINEALTVYNEWHGDVFDSAPKESTASMLDLSRWLSQQGDQEHARQILEKRLSENPNDLECLWEFGLSVILDGEYDLALSGFTRIIASPDADSRLKARALLLCGLMKVTQQDLDGAIADYTAVVDLDNAPVDHVAQALVNRGVAKRMQQNFDGAIADYTAVLQLENGPLDFSLQAGEMALETAPANPALNAGEAVVQAIDKWLGRFDATERTKHTVSLLRALAKPNAQEVWTYAYDELVRDKLDELPGLEVMGFVAAVLKTGNKAELDSLPPEQRDFVLEVLQKFKADTEQKDNPHQ